MPFYAFLKLICKLFYTSSIKRWKLCFLLLNLGQVNDSHITNRTGGSDNSWLQGMGHKRWSSFHFTCWSISTRSLELLSDKFTHLTASMLAGTRGEREEEEHSLARFPFLFWLIGTKCLLQDSSTLANWEHKLFSALEIVWPTTFWQFFRTPPRVSPFHYTD